MNYNKQEIIKIYNQTYELRSHIIENCKLMYHDYVYKTFDINKEYYHQILHYLNQLEYLIYKITKITANNIMYTQYLKDCYIRCTLLIYNIEHIDEIIKNNFNDVDKFNIYQHYNELEFILFNKY